MSGLITALAACPICFQIDQGPVSAGMRAAVVVLIAVTAAVIGAFVRFAVRLARRDAAIARMEQRP